MRSGDEKENLFRIVLIGGLFTEATEELQELQLKFFERASKSINSLVRELTWL